MLFDTHVNLHGETFATDLPDVLARARAAGVTRMISICDRLDNFEAIRAIAEANADIWCSVGVHPHHAKDFTHVIAEHLAELAQHPKVVGIGECGLDQHYGYSDLDQQVQVFEQHVRAAQLSDLPLIIHTREADDITGDILEREFTKQPFRMLLHCYTGGERLAQRALALGAWFSVSGILSFKAAQNVRDVIVQLPREKIILETDCPYLAPIPMRGRRNEPAFVAHVCEAYSKLRGAPVGEIAAETTRNALELFRRVA